MTGFNLPPGCSVRDLPGNTEADLAAEALGDAAYNWIDQHAALAALSDGEKDDLAVSICRLIDETASAAVARANADNQMAADLASQDVVTIDSWHLTRLRAVEKGLYGDGSILTADGRRDLANALNLVLSEMRTPNERIVADLARLREDERRASNDNTWTDEFGRTADMFEPIDNGDAE